MPGATARAVELTDDQLRNGRTLLDARVEALQPAVVAMLGVTAYRVAFEEPRAVVGEQLKCVAGARLWVVPNPSGLNAHETVQSLGDAYRAAVRAAGFTVAASSTPES